MRKVLAAVLLLVGCSRQEAVDNSDASSATAPASPPIITTAFQIQPQFVAALSFSSGVAAAADNTSVGYVDHAGKWIAAISETRPPKQDTDTRELSDLEKLMLLDPGSVVPGAKPMMVGDINVGALALKATSAEPATTLRSFNEDLAPHEVNGVYGFRNKSGQYVVKLQYEDARGFSEGLAAVKTVARWGYIDKTGAMVIPPTFIEAGDFHGGFAVVSTEYERYGYIDRTGREIIPSRYRAANPFVGDVALVYRDGGYGFVNRAGVEVIRPQYDYASDLVDGLAAFCPGECDAKTGKKGYINAKNEYVINPRFDEARAFSEGLAAIRIGDKWGYIRSDGQMAIQPAFDEAQSFKDGLAIVAVGDSKTFVNVSGGRPLQMLFQELEPYADGLALACINGKCGYLKPIQVQQNRGPTSR